MSISCSCDYDTEDCALWWTTEEAPKPLATKRSRKCCSCKAKLTPGTAACRIERWRNPVTDVEEKIFGEGGEIHLADWYFCPSCFAIYEALEKLKVCIELGADLRDDLEEFNRDYAPKGFSLRVKGMGGEG